MTRRQILDDPEIGNKAEAFEAFDDIPTNPNLQRTIGDVINARYGRRDILRGMLGVTATTALFGTSAMVAPRQASAATADSRYVFDELAWGNDETHHVADGYDANVLLRWGDPITADAPEFDVMNQTAAAQLKQFGYNNDYVGFVPLNDDGSRGLLCVNHEYTNEEVMFPGLGRQDRAQFSGMTPALIDIEMAAHGGSVVEIAKDDAGVWQVVRDGKMNRRITPLDTAMTIDGPAAGHARMKTNDDPDGVNVIGTLNNCAGGLTPWGTWLMAEENFHGYFWSDQLDADGKPVIADDHPEAASYKRYGVPGMWYAIRPFQHR
jgi:secreted PhoX family phosphatase